MVAAAYVHITGFVRPDRKLLQLKDSSDCPEDQLSLFPASKSYFVLEKIANLGDELRNITIMLKLHRCCATLSTSKMDLCSMTSSIELGRSRLDAP